MVLNVVVLFLCPMVSKKIGLEKMIRLCLVGAAIIYGGLFVVMSVTTVSALVYMVVTTIASGLSSISIFMQWGLVATVNDYHDYVTGKRAEGTVYGVFNLSRRVGQTIGNSAAVFALGVIGYAAGAATQPASAIAGIKAGCLLIPAIALVGSWIAFRFIWNITPDIRAKMEAKKIAAEK